MSDDMIFICFMIVAISSFFCPNSSLYPSPKYFSVLEDVSAVKYLDWSKFVYDSLMSSLKKFNNGNKGTGKKSKTLGGCMYFLAVYYLDFVNFSQNQVEGGLPRINFWKGNMIKRYSELDQTSSHSYGKRPLIEFSTSCYFQNCAFANKCLAGSKQHSSPNSAGIKAPPAIFRLKLDLSVGANLPNEVKDATCFLVQKHHKDESESSNTKSEILVLNVLQLLSEASSKDFCDHPTDKVEFICEKKNQQRDHLLKAFILYLPQVQNLHRMEFLLFTSILYLNINNHPCPPVQKFKYLINR